MLTGCRALDLTNENGFLCGKILADLGVDVIKIEEPGGNPSRKIGPFWHDDPRPENSLYWFAYNSNKRGITLNLGTRDGIDLFKALVKTADFIIESFSPGFMEKLGLDYISLDNIKKGIILTSISLFGQSGPYKEYKATDIVTMSMSGILFQTGNFNQVPLYMNIPQACHHAGADAAVGTLMAYYNKKRTGQGQHIDISLQQSAAWFLANAIPSWELNQTILNRSGTFRWSNYSMQRQVWKCKDGYVFFFLLGGKQGAKTFTRLVQWMEEEGMSNEFLKSMDWSTLDTGNIKQDVVDKISEPIEKFFLSRTKKEIDDKAAELRLSMCPLSSMQDLLNNIQLKARGFWCKLSHPESEDEIFYPKEFVKASEETYSTRFRAPLIGEHNKDIYTEIGLSNSDLLALSQSGVV